VGGEAGEVTNRLNKVGFSLPVGPMDKVPTLGKPCLQGLIIPKASQLQL